MKNTIQFLLLIITIALAACAGPGSSYSPHASHVPHQSYYNGSLADMEYESTEGEMRNIR